MPTENISLVSTSQPAASLMAESANSASSNSAAGLDSSSASLADSTCKCNTLKVE